MRTKILVNARSFFAAVAFAATATYSPMASAAQNWNNQTLGTVELDTRPCLFFQLTGVSQADPVSTGSPWFAVPNTNVNYQAIISLIFSAKLSGKSVYVYTDGTLSCGYATAYLIGLS